MELGNEHTGEESKTAEKTTALDDARKLIA